MTSELKVPSLGESVREATVARWLKKVGDPVHQDETLVELETDKVTLEVNAPMGGVLAAIDILAGQSVKVGQVLGQVSDGAARHETSPIVNTAVHTIPIPSEVSSQSTPFATVTPPFSPFTMPTTSMATPIAPSAHPSNLGSMSVSSTASSPSSSSPPSFFASPAAQKMIIENQRDPRQIAGSGPQGRITKADVITQETFSTSPSPVHSNPQTPEPSMPTPTHVSELEAAHEKQPTAPVPSQISLVSSQRQDLQVAAPEERVRMTRLRQRIAERLKEAQNTAALLTTFNEIDMSHVMATRDTYREKFEKRFGIKLGFMSFFVKAAVSALKELPSLNAEIQDDYIIYKNHYDIGVAVSAPQGLVVPVVRDADHLNFAEIERVIGQLSDKARTGKLSMEDLKGGTFTVTNGGVFGSLMSTPIINPPQSAILGMHKIQKRAVVIDDRIEIRPMMYVALTYDHRIIDGREAVTFLVRIKENIEDPQRILLGI